jgi:hypothetical protein
VVSLDRVTSAVEAKCRVKVALQDAEAKRRVKVWQGAEAPVLPLAKALPGGLLRATSGKAPVIVAASRVTSAKAPRTAWPRPTWARALAPASEIGRCQAHLPWAELSEV